MHGYISRCETAIKSIQIMHRLRFMVSQYRTTSMSGDPTLQTAARPCDRIEMKLDIHRQEVVKRIGVTVSAHIAQAIWKHADIQARDKR
jgi:hypothetical protein